MTVETSCSVIGMCSRVQSRNLNSLFVTHREHSTYSYVPRGIESSCGRIFRSPWAGRRAKEGRFWDSSSRVKDVSMITKSDRTRTNSTSSV